MALESYLWLCKAPLWK